ncbi:MAG: hypothetical protein PVH29_11960 [Candidatus Zixiibacteriota bacterium]|jgi:hypothetical protein
MRKSTFILLAAAATLVFAFGCGKKAEETMTGKDVEAVTTGEPCPDCEAAGTCDGGTCEGCPGGGGTGKGLGKGKGAGGGTTLETEEAGDDYRG